MQVKGRKAAKASRCFQGIYTKFFSPAEIMCISPHHHHLFLISKDFPLHPPISKSLLRRKVSALLPGPSKYLHSLTERISDTFLSSHSPYAHRPHTEELNSVTSFTNMSTSEPFPPR